MKEIVKHKVSYDTTKTLSVTCDICHTKYEGDKWNNDWYEVDDTSVYIEIKHKTGQSFPEGGSGEELDIDICPKCFATKLVPWIQSFGTKLEKKDWEW